MKSKENNLDNNIEEKHEFKEHEIRLEKVKELEKLSINPWPENQEPNSNAQKIINEFEKLKDPETNKVKNKEYTIAGRILSIRTHGKTIFADLVDDNRIQIYIKKDNVGQELFEIFNKFIDLGDIVWVCGYAFKTKMGEITLEVNNFKLLSKCLRPLPEKFHGLSDIEIKYRQRYLDLITSEETKNRFIKRSKLIKSIRCFLDSKDYMEVETPMLHPIAGGALAKPFTTHHNTLNADFYLRIAPELYLKRLVVGGFKKVYEINRNFRNEGISTRHNPEFTMIEIYTAYKDYKYAMHLTEQILQYAATQVTDSQKLNFGNHVIDFSQEFKRLSIKDAVKIHANLTDQDLVENNIDQVIKKFNIKLKNINISLQEKIYTLFEQIVESKLIQPTFIIDFPIEVSPLSKRDPDNLQVASRFELFIAGMEIANGFNELNDPFDQEKRFKDQLKAHESGDEEAHQFDADYILALEYGLPPTAGVGIGIDRLAMLLTNTTSIKEIILFPTLKKLA